MFTGIVQAIGHISHAHPLNEAGTDIRLTVTAPASFMKQMEMGESIAHQGVCLTIVEFDAVSFKVDVSAETLRLTYGLEVGHDVNLEKSLTLQDKLGGHLVSGHVDGMGTVAQFKHVDVWGGSWQLRISVSRSLAPYLARKGSVAVNGVSLTVNTVEDTADACLFDINIIPHTYEVTTMKQVKIGDRVNIEIDTLARYCERIVSLSAT
jgi:riboflavin synthase